MSIVSRLNVSGWWVACAILLCLSCTESASESDLVESPASDRCASDADCQEGLCDPIQGCVACQFAKDCGEEQICRNYDCHDIVTCESDDDCAGSELPSCGQEGVCVECSTDEQCGESARCDRGSSQCVTVELCKNSVDCGAGTVCDRSLGYCVGCIADDDCAEGSVCDESTCRTACTESSQCSGDRPHCDTVRGHCTACLADDDCPGEYFCAAGKCQLDTCEAGTSQCAADGNAIVRCRDNGSETTTVFCSSGTTCEDGVKAATCTPWLCNPGETYCGAESNWLKTCDETGLSLASQLDCRDMSGRCSGVACEDVVCNPGTTFCEGGNSYQCDALGITVTLAAACGAGFFCNEATGTCEVDVCLADSKICDGDVLKTCNSEGTGYLTEETDCTDSDSVCVNSACRPVICSFDSRCNGTAVETCSSKGTRIASTGCSSSYHCNAEGNTASCKSDVCSQGQTACSAGTFGTCNADGSGYAGDYLVCADEGLSCSSNLGCYGSIGSSWDSTSSSYFLANEYTAAADVTLTSISHYVNLYSSYSTGYTAVYEKDPSTGDYTRLFLDTDTPGSYYSTWLVEDAVELTLKAGKTYLIGFRSPAVDYVFYGSSSTGSAGDTLGQLTFNGRLSTQGTPESISATTLTTTSAYYQRLGFQ